MLRQIIIEAAAVLNMPLDKKEEVKMSENFHAFHALPKKNNTQDGAGFADIQHFTHGNSL